MKQPLDLKTLSKALKLAKALAESQRKKDGRAQKQRKARK